MDQFIPIAVVIGYLALTTAIGIAVYRRNTSGSQWAVGGSGMGLAMISVGIAGTRIGGAGTYGVSGDVIGDGVWNLWWYGITTFFALAITGLFFAVPYRRLKLQTVGEVFTIRFGSRRSQVLTSLCVQTEYLAVNIIEAYAIAVMLRGLMDVPMIYGVFIAAAIIVSYTAFGGLWGAAVTNLIHCIAIIGGFALVGILGVQELGGWQAVTERVDAHLIAAGKDTTRWWAFMGPGWIPVLGMFFSAAIHTPAASVYTNFATAAKNEKVLIPGFLLAGVFAAIMPILAGLIGILTLAEYGPDAGIRGYSNITKFATDISPYIGGAALAAVLAAIVSSGGPILLSSSTMFVRDWLPFTNSYTATEKLRAYRITTVIYGFLAAILAWVLSTTGISILDLLLFGFAMVVPPAIAIGYLIYWPRTTEPGAFWGMLTGYAAGLAWFAVTKWMISIGFEAGEGASALRETAYYFFIHQGDGIDPSYATTLVPLIFIPLLSWFTREQTEGKERFYAVVRGHADYEPAAE